MPRSNPLQPGHGRKSANSESAHATVTHSPDPEPPSPEQLACLAEMVVEGAVEFPGNFAAGDEARLVMLVRQRLRTRLVRFLARQIALDIYREAEQLEG